MLLISRRTELNLQRLYHISRSLEGRPTLKMILSGAFCSTTTRMMAHILDGKGDYKFSTAKIYG